ncbi:MAG: mechanosensitive ion channel family protein, partial [Erysipelotrichaceae bacterium]|nr:mechanosensitive ion channel family protein [Erysipelotrichaceae bacterium]
IVAVSLVLLYIIKQYLIKKVAYTTKNEQHKNTFIGIIFSVLQYFVVLIAAVMIMKVHGIDITGILAGLGIVATIVGLALQDTLKDIFAGINIYNNNFYKVGDMVRYNGEECDVKYFSARVTKFQSLRTNSTYTVCNSMINSIEKIKDRGIITFLFPFDTDKKVIDKAMNKVADRMLKECKHVKEIYYDGISEINVNGVLYEIKYHCPAHHSEEVRDMIAGISYEEFNKAKIRPAFSTIYK